MLSAIPLKGQNNTNSPYSTRGFGEIEQFTSAYSRALGGVQNGIRTQRSIAFSNPASISGLKYVAFDFGFRTQYSQLSLDQKTRTQYAGNFNYFNLAFPVYKKQLLKDSSTNKNKNKLYKEYKTIWASGFGISPYSSINSSYYTIQKFNNDTIIDQGNYYSKTGGLSQLYWMNGVNITPNISLGLTSAYLFGQHRNTENYYVFDTGKTRRTYYDNSTQLSGFKFDLGLQIERNRDTIVRHDSVFEGGKMVYKTFRYPIRWVFGASYQPQASMQFSDFRQIITLSNYYSSAAKDTVANENNIKGNTNIPSAFSAGFSVTLDNKWLMAADYRKEFWSKMNHNLFSDSFQNGSQISVGFAYRPDPDVQFGDALKAKGKKQAKLEYRFGFRSKNWGYLFKNNLGQLTPIHEYGLSFGLGIPKTRTDIDGRNKILLKSLFNVSAEYIRRGNNSQGLIAENVFRLTIGFTFADNWFKQRKFY